MLKKSLIAAFFVLTLGINYSFAQIILPAPEKKESKEEKKDSTETKKDKPNDFGIIDAKSPAEWIQKASFLINGLFIKSVKKVDSLKWSADFDYLDKQILDITNEVVNLKNIDLSIKEIKDLNSRAHGLKSKLDLYSEDIKSVSTLLITRYNLASLINEESFLKVINKDTSLKTVFNDEFASLKESADTIKAKNLRMIKNLTVRENRKNELSITLAVVLEIIKQKSEKWQSKILTQDEPAIWNMFGKEYTPPGTILSNSFNFVYNSFTTYFRNQWSKIMLMKILLVIISIVLLFYYRNFRLKNKFNDFQDLNLEYINKFPWIIPFLAILFFIQFVFPYPPLILSQFILLLIMILVSYISYKKFNNRSYVIPYIVIFAYYILVKVNDFILEISIFERIFYFLSLVPVFYLIIMVKDINKNPFGNKRFVISLLVFLILHLLLGFFLNLIGMVAFCKVVISGGIRGFYMAIFINIVLYTFMDYLNLAFYSYGARKSSIEMDLSKIRQKIIRLLFFFAFAIWMYMYLNYINILDSVLDFTNTLLTEERTIGSSSFNIGTFAIFFLILFLSFYISGMIKQIVEVNDIKQDKIRRSNAGGIMLVMRLIVISLGFLLAIAASGLPLDKLTILISALGVGIGFGLQNIINNLVSGVIIAVERPFRVGDLVNFGGVDGTVKMIGIRSSVVTSQDGSELIIPNGDLISKNLINWTSNNKFRKDSLNVEINSGIDDGDFINLINETIKNSEINTFITGHQLSIISYNKGIQKWELSFWITDIGKYSYIKSKTIQIIFEKLKENSIEVVTFQ